MIDIIPFLIFTTIFLVNKRYVGRFFCLSNYIHLLYMLSTLSFALMKIVGDNKPYNLEALLLLVLSNIILVFPLSRIEKKMGGNTRKKGVQLSTINEYQLIYFCQFLIGISFVSLVFFGSNIPKFFTVDIVNLRQEHGSLYEGGSILSKVACLGAYLYPICMFMYFYNIVKKQLPKYYSYLLFISSLSFIIYGLNVAGRDGIVLWFATFLGLYFLFNIFMSRDDVKHSNRLLSIVGITAVPLLLFISIARFSDSNNGTGWAMTSYMGQSLGNLSQNIDAYHRVGETPSDASGTLEVVYAVGNLFSSGEHDRHKRFGRSYNDILWQTDSGFTPYAFSYYIGGFYPMTMTLFWYLFFLTIWWIILLKNVRIKKGKVMTSQLIVAFAWYTILISGIFYFYYGTFIGNFFLLITLFIPLILKNNDIRLHGHL